MPDIFDLVEDQDRKGGARTPVVSQTGMLAAQKPTSGDIFDQVATPDMQMVPVPRKRNEAMGGPPKGYQAPGPPTGMPFYSSAVSLAKGAAPFLRPSTTDQKLGGAADLLEGGAGIAGDAAMSQLGLGAAGRLGQVNPFNAALRETAANLTQDAWRRLGIPAIKGLAGAGLGGLLGAGAADLTGAGPGGQRLATEGGAMLGGLASGLRRSPQGGVELAAGAPKPKFQPPPRTEAFVQVLRPKEADLLRLDFEQSLERGASEILHDNPSFGDGTFALTRPGSTVKRILDGTNSTLKRIWSTGENSIRPNIVRGQTVNLDNTTRRMHEALPHDPLGEGRLLSDVSPDLQAQMQGLAKKPMNLQKAWDLWREWNADLGVLNRKSGAMAREALTANKGDVKVMEARVNGLREDIYNSLRNYDPAQAEHMKEVMDSYGAVAKYRNGIEGRLAEAYQEVPTGMLERLWNLGMAGAKIQGGGSAAWAAPNVKAAVSADNAVANQLLNAFKGFGAPNPRLADFYGMGSGRDQVVKGLLGPGPVRLFTPDTSGPIQPQVPQGLRVRPAYTTDPGIAPGQGIIPPSRQLAAPSPQVPNPAAKTFGGNPQPRIPQGQVPPVQQPSILEQYGRGVSIPAVRTGNPFAQSGAAGTQELSPQRVGQFALEHGIPYPEALKQLQLQMQIGRAPNPWGY